VSACLGAALIGYDRLAAAGALAWIALLVSAGYRRPEIGMLLVSYATPIAAFAVMLTAPRRRSRRIRRLAWLIPIAALGATAGGVGPDTYLLLAPLGVVIPLALQRLARDPRLAIACSLFAFTVAMAETSQVIAGEPLPIGLPLTLLLFSAAPVVIAFAVLAQRTRLHADGA
jgi:hypothetical protein